MGTLRPALLLLLVALVKASYKKGVVVSKGNYHCHDTDAFSNIHWWYDYRQTPEWHHDEKHCTNTLHVAGKRVPMVWGWRSKDHTLTFTNHSSRYVLGFNEPNHKHQANLTPQEAAEGWRHIQARADKQNQLLVGPSAIDCHTERCMMPGVQWYREFFGNCTGCRVDYLSTHTYTCHADSTMGHLKQLWDIFHKPIWLTEFSCPSTDQDRIEAYMKDILPQLEHTGYVAKYAWFSDRIAGTGAAKQEASLLHRDSSQLTQLGNYYNNYQ